MKEVAHPIPSNTTLFGIKLFISLGNDIQDFPLNLNLAIENDSLIQFETGNSNITVSFVSNKTVEYVMVTSQQLDFGNYETAITASILHQSAAKMARVYINVTYRCTGEECSNGGTCISLVNRYMCLCLVTFTGEQCLVSIDICVNGIFIDGILCECYIGWEGEYCDTESNVTSSENVLVDHTPTPTAYTGVMSASAIDVMMTDYRGMTITLCQTKYCDYRFTVVSYQMACIIMLYNLTFNDDRLKLILKSVYKHQLV